MCAVDDVYTLGRFEQSPTSPRTYPPGTSARVHIAENNRNTISRGSCRVDVFIECTLQYGGIDHDVSEESAAVDMVAPDDETNLVLAKHLQKVRHIFIYV
jgi:hypothetical protein